MLDADAIIVILGLRPHPEGGHYAETWRADAPPGTRAVGSAIYFLLRAGERSAWHRIDAGETWHYYAGAPLRLAIVGVDDTVAATSHELGPDIIAGQRPQVTVPPGAWQSAVSMGDWTLVGCTVSPAFDFAGFELAPRSWEPGAA